MKNVLNLPNIITILRILFIPVFMWIMYSEIPNKNYIAAVIFLILAASDGLDGYIARKYNKITDFGKILDPIADKFLIAAGLIVLINIIPLWMILVIFAREIIITIARIFILKKKVIHASFLGKLKTVSQIVAILALLIQIPYAIYIMWVAVIITVVSGLDYIVKMIRITKKQNV